MRAALEIIGKHQLIIEYIDRIDERIDDPLLVLNAVHIAVPELLQPL